MANYPARITLTVQDIEGVKSGYPLYLEITDTETLAEIMTELGTMAGLVEAITDGVVVKQAIQIGSTPAAQDDKPTSTSFAGYVGSFSFVPSNNRRWTADIASFARSKVTAGKIVLSDADVAAFTAHISGSAAPLLYTNPDGLAVSTFLDSRLSTRKHRRAERALSEEYDS